MEALAAELDAELVPMGSAGVKVISVVRDVTDAYVHAGGQYEWDNAAPVAVARAAGLFCSRVDGSELRYNQDDVSLPDLIVCRPELAEPILAFVRGTAPTSTTCPGVHDPFGLAAQSFGQSVSVADTGRSSPVHPGAGTAEPPGRSRVMWDTVESNSQHLSHDMPCTACGHAQHSYLPCSDSCECECTPPSATAARPRRLTILT